MGSPCVFAPPPLEKFPSYEPTPLDGSLWLDHHVSSLHIVPAVIAETIPDRVVDGRIPDTASRKPPSSAEIFGTVEPILIVIHVRGGELHPVMWYGIRRANISENVVRGTGDTTPRNTIKSQTFFICRKGNITKIAYRNKNSNV